MVGFLLAFDIAAVKVRPSVNYAAYKRAHNRHTNVVTGFLSKMLLDVHPTDNDAKYLIEVRHTRLPSWHVFVTSGQRLNKVIKNNPYIWPT